MVWDEISATISFIQLSVEQVGTYTVKVRVENSVGEYNEADFVFEIQNEIQSEEILAQIMTQVEQTLEEPQQTKEEPNQEIDIQVSETKKAEKIKFVPKFSYIDDYRQEVAKRLTKNDEEEEKVGKFVGFIKKITSTGKVYLRFTNSLSRKFQEKKRRLQDVDFKDIFEIIIIPNDQKSDDESVEEQERSLDKLSLDWEVTDIQDNELIIQIKFAHAEEVSLGRGKDFLAVKIKDNEENTSLFTSDDGKETLDPASYVMVKPIQK